MHLKAVQAVPSTHPLAAFLRQELSALVPPNTAASSSSRNSYSGNNASGDVVSTAPPSLHCNGTTLEFSTETGNLEQLTFGHQRGRAGAGAGAGAAGAGAGAGAGGVGMPWARMMDVRYITFRDESKKGMVCNQSKF